MWLGRYTLSKWSFPMPNLTRSKNFQTMKIHSSSTLVLTLYKKSIAWSLITLCSERCRVSCFGKFFDEPFVSCTVLYGGNKKKKKHKKAVGLPLLFHKSYIWNCNTTTNMEKALQPKVDGRSTRGLCRPKCRGHWWTKFVQCRSRTPS